MRIAKLFVLIAICLGISACSSWGKNQAKNQEMSGSDIENPSQALARQVDLTAKPLECPSTVTLDLKSSNYSGQINIEFRSGKRPGSKRLQSAKINTSGTVTIENVCAGSYFFAFSTPDSPSVSVTQYFDVINNGRQYSNPRITVTYTRAATKNAVQTVGRSSL